MRPPRAMVGTRSVIVALRAVATLTEPPVAFLARSAGTRSPTSSSSTRHMVPSASDELRGLAIADIAFDRQRSPARSIRTEAHSSRRRRTPSSEHGFVVADRLALLERALLDRTPQPRHAPTARRSRLRRAPTSTTSPSRPRSIDRRAFPRRVARTTSRSLEEIANGATPTARMSPARRWFGRDRVRRADRRSPSRGGPERTGWLPPASRRRPRGIARARLGRATPRRGRPATGSLRRGANRVLVNTGVDNEAALDLYRQLGFWRRSEELAVMESTVSR